MKKTALIVIDVQNALVLKKPFSIDEIIQNIQVLIETCRKNNIEVIYVQHNGKEGGGMEPHSEGWQIYTKFKPSPNKKLFLKIIRHLSRIQICMNILKLNK